MKPKATFESVLAAIAAAIFSYIILNTPATLAAFAIRRRMPDAWFSSSIVWYATAVVLTTSVTIAAVVFRIVYKQTEKASSKVVTKPETH